jgi:hypothetical protein
MLVDCRSFCYLWTSVPPVGFFLKELYCMIDAVIVRILVLIPLGHL